MRLNKVQREKVGKFASALVDIQEAIQSMSEDESVKYENIPESLRYSDRALELENAADALMDVSGELENLIDRLNNIQEGDYE
jgi:hypothetical protein